MPRGYFLTPLFGDGSHDNPYHGKYAIAEDFATPPTQWRGSTIDLWPDMALIRLELPTPADFAEVNGDPATILIARSDQLGDVITPQQETVADAWCEARNLPGNIVEAGMTRKQALKRFVGISYLCMEMRNRFGAGWRERLAQSSLTMSSTWQQLPTGVRQELLDMATAEGWTAQSLGLTNTSTLREVLRAMGAAWVRSIRPFNDAD